MKIWKCKSQHTNRRNTNQKYISGNTSRKYTSENTIRKIQVVKTNRKIHIGKYTAGNYKSENRIRKYNSEECTSENKNRKTQSGKHTRKLKLSDKKSEGANRIPIGTIQVGKYKSVNSSRKYKSGIQFGKY